ncbi:TPA: hypothetical protein N0F65_005226 [Lagenidium giganteum]|uniref:Phospholipid/glycerol acyltransferase domain-containing protein n=1 Tax=Lagenidium giganteum TaxID=4803 RepID=A0AAV2YSD4_9STRA|nr:TPA: hypothetical protein N0F65_005226 [Lagenidium giganteum]
MTPPVRAMEQVYAGKCLFITGATGFVGKAIVEKLLRSVPNVQKIFVLIRPRKGVASADRLRKEIINSPIFNRLRQERGASDFEAFATAKLHAVSGDVTSPMLGLSDAEQALLREHVQIVIHSAATVQFNEPIEVAVEMNCIGAMHALRFVQSCPRVICHVHVSTAYVNSNLRDLRMREELYPLDFNVEEAVEAITKASPSEFERLHVNLIGTYPNTYALTKSMAEHMIVKHAGPNLPLVIFRPTIIGAAWKEPVPGWVDQIAGAGAIFLAVGMGVLTILPGDPRNVADIVPVDLCVNSLLVACCTKILSLPSPSPFIVHSGTSDPRQNPLRWRVPCTIVPEYFRKNPPARGLFPSKFSMIQTHQNFQVRWFLSYALPSSVYSTAANAMGNPHHMKEAARLWQLTWRARTLVEVFKPFTENQWVFVADSLDLLKEFASDEWWVDADDIVWERYVFNFCVGLKKFMLHEDVIDVDIEGVTHTELALSTGRMLEWDADHHAISFPGLLSDVAWAYTSSRKPGYTKSGLLGRFMGLTGWKEGINHEASHVPRRHVDSVGAVRNQVLESEAVREAIAARVEETGLAFEEVEQEALKILDVMAAQVDYRSVRKLGWLLRKVCRHMYENINVDEKGLVQVRELLRRGESSVVLVPTHRSYVDFLLMSYLFFAYNIPVPYIAAGRDFLNMGWISKLLRESGAYFIRRSFREDGLYSAVFKEYTQYLVSKGHTIEFFIEGSRSRSGKQLDPKFGILSTVVDCYLSGRVDNVHFVPVTIDYEKPLEVLLHQNELLGEGKIKESLSALLKSLHVTRQNFGSISVQFGEPIDMQKFASSYGLAGPDRSIANPQQLIRDLGYQITDEMISYATCTPSNVVATILLMYRNGISKQDLVQQTNWLRLEVLKRGGRVMCTQGRSPTVIVERALEFLKELVSRRRKDLVEPAITSREQYPNMIGLGYYRNKILHWFNREGVLACAHFALSTAQSASSNSAATATTVVDKAELIENALFLHDMLRMEFVRKDSTRDRSELETVLQLLHAQEVFQQTGGAVGAVADGQPTYTLLCTMIWPFIDSYWVAITSLFALRPQVEMTVTDLLKRIQWLAETMYHERIISFYESCSLETLQNAITLLQKWDVIQTFSPKQRKSRKSSDAPAPPALVRLRPQFQEADALEQLAQRVAKFRKLPAAAAHNHALGQESNVIARLPALSKM